MARIPDRRENARRFAELDAVERREIARAVNRGRAVNTRRDAVIAVGVARRQQRFWGRAWLLAPALGVVQAFTVDPLAAIANTLASLVALGGMCLWFHRRARRSEAANLALLGDRVLDADPPSRGRLTSRLTGRRGAAPPARQGTPKASGARSAGGAADGRAVADDDPDSSDAPGAPGPATGRTPGRAPYQPRGRKRRR